MYLKRNLPIDFPSSFPSPALTFLPNILKNPALSKLKLLDFKEEFEETSIMTSSYDDFEWWLNIIFSIAIEKVIISIWTPSYDVFQWSINIVFSIALEKVNNSGLKTIWIYLHLLTRSMFWGDFDSLCIKEVFTEFMMFNMLIW